MYFEIWMMLTLLGVVITAFWHINKIAFRKGKVEGMYEIMIKLHHEGKIDFDDEGNVKPITAYQIRVPS